MYVATGGNISIAAGRLSFALGTQGPCASYDTACSSALVALHGSASALRAAECCMSLTLAVSLMLSNLTHGLYARAGMLSADGRCKTFDARANGYARGEGISATTLRDAGDGVRFLGSRVRSDGSSASLTAPNGTAQARMIGAALATTGVGKLRLVEAHGTGTPLGDPTEARGLERALGECGPCLGSAKASLGHTEPAAGLAGLLTLCRILTQRRGSANAQLRVLNGLLRSPLRGLGVFLPSQDLLLVAGAAAGVSSFGYSGTIAHTIVRGCAADELLRKVGCDEHAFPAR